jgi:hypothetical protein
VVTPDAMGGVSVDGPTYGVIMTTDGGAHWVEGLLPL